MNELQFTIQEILVSSNLNGVDGVKSLNFSFRLKDSKYKVYLLDNTYPLRHRYIQFSDVTFSDVNEISEFISNLKFEDVFKESLFFLVEEDIVWEKISFKKGDIVRIKKNCIIPDCFSPLRYCSDLRILSTENSNSFIYLSEYSVFKHDFIFRYEHIGILE